MARTILEDYFKTTESHFDLAHHIPIRAREIQRRGNARVVEHDDKPIVVALREISEQHSRFDPTEELDMAEAAAMKSDFAASIEAHITDSVDAVPEMEETPLARAKREKRAAKVAAEARAAEERKAEAVAYNLGDDPAAMGIDPADMGYPPAEDKTAGAAETPAEAAVNDEGAGDEAAAVEAEGDGGDAR